VNIFLREPQRTLENAELLMQLCREHQFSGFLAHGLAQRGWALVELGHYEEGIAQLRQGLDKALMAGSQITYGWYVGLLAEALAEVGAVADAERVLEDAVRAVPAAELGRPEWLRFRADLLARQGAEAPTVEAAYRDAIAVAQRQGARSYELRATTSLGRWLQSHDRAAEAHTLLGPLYAWFTEGFDTRDLREAKALLEELG